MIFLNKNNYISTDLRSQSFKSILEQEVLGPKALLFQHQSANHSLFVLQR